MNFHPCHFISTAICSLTAVLSTSICFSQKESFDIINYSVPAGWQKQDGEGAKVFLTENKTTGGYCIISLFKSSVATDLESDFRKAWQDIPVKAYNAPLQPASTEKADAKDGWKALSGSAQLKVENTDALCLLTVLSGEKRTFTVFALLNDQSFAGEIDKFFQELEINHEALVAVAGGSTGNPEIKQSAGIQTFDNFIYRVPEGWTSKQEANFMELFPQKVKPEEVFSIILLKGKTSSAPLKQELSSCWDEFASLMRAEKLREVSGGYYNEEEVSKTFAGWEYVAGHGSIRTQADFFMHAYVIRVKDRVERVVVLSKEIRLDAMRSNIDPSLHHTPYYNTITDFIFSLRFSNFTSPDLQVPTWKGEGVNGVWAGIGFMGGKLKTTYAIFFSNGQVFYGSRFPLQGLHELNTYAEKERAQRYWGTYTFQNGKGTVKMSYGSFPIRLEGGKLVMAPVSEEHSFIRMPSLDDMKLNGTWKIQGQNNEWVAVSFTSEGGFTDNGALRVLDHTAYVYYSIADGGGSGNYAIIDHTIIFRYDDGRILKVAFPGKNYTPGDNSPKELVLSFNDDLLIKQ